MMTWETRKAKPIRLTYKLFLFKGSFNMTLANVPNLMSLALIVSEKNVNLPFFTFNLDLFDERVKQRESI